MCLFSFSPVLPGVFLVLQGFLPFGFSSALYIFTELLRPLVAYWRLQGIHIVVYLYDGLGEAPSYQVTFDLSTKVKSDLVHSEFVPNSEKSIWVPTLVIDWLGFIIDFFQGLLFIPGKKIKRQQGPRWFHLSPPLVP